MDDLFLPNVYNLYVTGSKSKRLMLPMQKLQMPDFSAFNLKPQVIMRSAPGKRLVLPMNSKFQLPDFGSLNVKFSE